MRRYFLPILLASSVAALAACGQKGPLYLPNEPQAEPPPATQVRNTGQQEASQDTKPTEQDQ